MLWFIVVVILFTVMEFLTSIHYKTYQGYSAPRVVEGFGSWVYYSWNFIGQSRNYPSHIVRVVGVRWFGHEWEAEYEVPMGELRF